MRRITATALFLIAAHVLAPAPVRGEEAAIESRWATVLGAKIHYLDSGAGRPMLMVHGLGGSADSLRPLIPALAAGRRVLAPDLLGFGRSDKPFVNYTLETFVDVLEGFMKATGLEKADLMGLTMGARVGSLFALRHPERVDRLILMDGAAYRPAVTPEMLRALNPSTVAAARRMLELIFFDDSKYATQRAAEEAFAARVGSGTGHTIEKVLESFRRGEGFAESLAGIRAPTLILWGRHDEISPVALAERAHREIAGSRLVVIESAGHLPFVEAPREFEASVLEFLGAPPRAAP